jgi:hypothetical protein
MHIFIHENCMYTDYIIPIFYCSNSHDMNLDRVTDGHVKLNILDDTQECLNNSHHRIALEYDEDTLSLVVDPTLSTSNISVFDNSNSSTGNAECISL